MTITRTLIECMAIAWGSQSPNMGSADYAGRPNRPFYLSATGWGCRVDSDHLGDAIEEGMEYVRTLPPTALFGKRALTLSAWDGAGRQYGSDITWRPSTGWTVNPDWEAAKLNTGAGRRLYSTRQAAETLGISKSRINQLCREHGYGQLVGTSRVLTQAEVDAMAEHLS